eukprot:768508-Hanusia_phi.AAC.3
MNATSAAMVPSAGSPDRRKHSMSSQLRMKRFLTPASSSTLEYGPSSDTARGLSREGRKRSRVATSPRSKRMAAGGMATEAAASGAM